VQISQAQLYSLVNSIRLKETTYKSAGSVHACALFECLSGEPQLLFFVEDVGRHNAIDTIAGWMAMNRQPPQADADDVTPPQPRVLHEGETAWNGLVFYTTGRLTSEMVIKSAQMGVPIVVSRSGMTQMGHEVAQKVGLCAIGRATNKRFVCYTHPARILFQPELAEASRRLTSAES
jgi:FdhD protein